MPRTPIHVKDFDVPFVGTGPVGCTFARTLFDQGYSILMVDSRSRQSPNFGTHLKNAFPFQRDVDPLGNVARGHLHALSVPPNQRPAFTPGGSISIGHPFGMTGSRMVGTLANEMERRKARYGIVTMCIGGGQGAAGLFEAAHLI